MSRLTNPTPSHPATDDPLRQAFRAYAASVAAAGSVPPASLVWFRAERRRRALALRRAQRPVRIMQAIGLLCALVAAGWAAAHFVPVARFGSLPPAPAMATPLLALLIAGSGVVLLGCGGLLLASRHEP